MAMEGKPPFPNFLASIYALLIFLLVLANDFLNENSVDISVPPLLPLPLLQSIVSLIIVLASVDTRKSCLVNRLFPNFHGRRNKGRDVWAILERNPHIFWYYTGETPRTLEVLVSNIQYDVASPRHIPRIPSSNRRRRCLLDTRNRVLLVMTWLRQYLKFHVLAYLFDIRKSTVGEEIYHIVPILFVRYRHYVTWHGINRWRQFLGTFIHFPNAVGIIDATIHKIRRPSGPRQADFYRGDKRCHFMSSQVVIDADGLIVLLVSG